MYDFIPQRSLAVLPMRDRCLLRLFIGRGASVAELAGLMGTEWHTVKRRVGRLVAWLRSPDKERMLAAWPSLGREQRRLLYMRRILDMPLRNISRLGLVHHGPDLRPASVSTLRRMLREIDRRIGRYPSAG